MISISFIEPIKKPLSPSRRRTKLQKYRQERAAAAQTRPPQGLNVSDDDLFILIEVEELKFQIEVLFMEDLKMEKYLGLKFLFPSIKQLFIDLGY